MGVFALLHRAAAEVGRVHQFVRELFLHGLPRTMADRFRHTEAEHLLGGTTRASLVDALIIENGPIQKEWDGIWLERTRRTEQGWSAEFAIPFKSLSFHRGQQTWGFNVSRTIKRKDPPGAVWQYKTLDTAVLGWLLERVSGGSTVADYTAQRLWEPLGAEANGFYIMDGAPGAGREFSGAGFNATLRDFARIGQMVLNGGQANGHQIVSQQWLAESTRPTGGPGPGYGFQWWMGQRPGSFQALGLQGQYIYIDPPSRTVIVKLSYFPPGDMTADSETAAFLASASAWSPR